MHLGRLERGGEPPHARRAREAAQALVPPAGEQRLDQLELGAVAPHRVEEPGQVGEHADPQDDVRAARHRAGGVREAVARLGPREGVHGEAEQRRLDERLPVRRHLDDQKVGQVVARAADAVGAHRARRAAGVAPRAARPVAALHRLGAAVGAQARAERRHLRRRRRVVGRDLALERHGGVGVARLAGAEAGRVGRRVRQREVDRLRQSVDAHLRAVLAQRERDDRPGGRQVAPRVLGRHAVQVDRRDSEDDAHRLGGVGAAGGGEHVEHTGRHQHDGRRR